MKKFITRIFVELYHWQNDNWGQDNLPALTSLLLLSILQLFNVLSVLVIIQKILSVNIFGFLVNNLMVGIVMHIGILLLDYSIVNPIKETVKEYQTSRKRALIYTFLTILVFAISLALWQV